MDPVSKELARGLLLLDSGPWAFPLPPRQGRAPKVPVRRVRGRLSLDRHTEVQGKYRLPQWVEYPPNLYVVTPNPQARLPSLCVNTKRVTT